MGRYAGVLMRLGLLARMDNTGLGAQTRAMARMLKPDNTMLIDSKSFNGNIQHPEWYRDFKCGLVKGFPSSSQCVIFLRGLTHIVTCETAYNNYLYSYANARGIKTFCQPNYEFADHFINDKLPKPTMWFMPSYWHLEDWQEKMPNTIYLPPPTFMEDFDSVAIGNLERKGKFRTLLHIVGNAASFDRNGTEDVLGALKYTNADFKLVIRSQRPLKGMEHLFEDPRVEVDITDHPNQADLYKGADAMVMPRRYGGLCLPMNEALMSALPVIMTNISPNNKILPADWLVQSQVKSQFMARMPIDVHACDIAKLGKIMGDVATMSNAKLFDMKQEALQIGTNNYSPEVLKPKYLEVMEQ